MLGVRGLFFCVRGRCSKAEEGVTGMHLWPWLMFKGLLPAGFWEATDQDICNEFIG